MNQAPAASADSITANEDEPGTVGVLANDSDPDGDALAVTDATDGDKGAVTCDESGLCTYTPHSDLNGTDSFTYTAADGRGGSATATVSVTVRPVNDEPRAVVDVSSAPAGGTFVLRPAANDVPGPADEAGQALTVRALPGPPSYGDAEVVSPARVEYRPPETYAGPDWFEYEVCDDAAEQRCARGSVRLDVTPVAPVVETDPVPHEGDAADDAAIWVNAAAPAHSRVIGTDKGGTSGEGGLAVYDLDGNEVQYLAGGRLNNVDVRPDFPLTGGAIDLVAATDRTSRAIALYRMDRANGTLVDLGSPIGLEFEPYGICLYRSPVSGKDYAFVTRRDTSGYAEQWELRDGGGGRVSGVKVRSFAVGSLSEGCVADQARRAVYVAEEDVGIWRYGAEPGDGDARVSVDAVGEGTHLGPDVEGLALAEGADGGGYLAAVSQEAGEFVLYERTGENEFARSFALTEGGGIDETSSMDGIAVSTAALGPTFPEGLLVSHDGSNAGAAGPENQNFKLIPLQHVLGDREASVPPRPTNCFRPYTAESPWNMPIPASPTLDPESALHLTAFTGSQLTSDPTQFTYPVYEVTAATPRVPVHISGWFSNVTGNGTRLDRLRDPTVGVTIELPIPAGAEAAAGSDAQIILHDPATGDEWGVWRLEWTDTGWRATNGYHYNTAWSGVPPFEDGDPQKPFLSRGAGVPYFTGLVRPCELARGRIDHALAFAYDSPTHEHVYPATKSDGNSGDGDGDETDSHPYDVPEGTRLQLDPTLTQAQIKAWGCSGACLTMARALQTHGMYVIDNSARPKVMLEYDGTARWGGAVTVDTVRPIPFSAFRVLAPPAP